MLKQDDEFSDRGQRWAKCMLHRLKEQWLDVPLVWPGTHEQAETIVHAFTDESLAGVAREHLVEVVQSGARVAWQCLTAISEVTAPSIGHPLPAPST